MRYAVLATDFDGTLAHDGTVAEPVWAALERLVESGRRAVLVTGRLLEDLLPLVERPERFSLIVAENGALVYDPATKTARTIVEPPPPAFVAELRKRGVTPLEVGHVIVATWEPNEKAVLDAIRDVGLEWHVTFNKGAVMALPAGVTKATGLQVALDELETSRHNLVAVGDGENDGAMLTFAECGVAVANAIPLLKERADVVTTRDHGAGVRELVGALLRDDLSEAGGIVSRHGIVLGRDTDGEEVTLAGAARGMLVFGTSGGGKSTLTTLILERLREAGYQFCALDPEGDYSSFEDAIVVGSVQASPTLEEISEGLRSPTHSLILNTLAVPPHERPAYFSRVAKIIDGLRHQRGRPHWLVVEEAHHFMPVDAGEPLDIPLSSVLLVTTRPQLVQPRRLRDVDTMVAVGDDARRALEEAVSLLAIAPPPHSSIEPTDGGALVWTQSSGTVRAFRADIPRTTRVRHRRKYATGELAESKSFYFRGPGERLNLRAQNLMTFVQLARGIDDETWLHHLRRGDYSKWFAEMIGDEGLARDALAVEGDTAVTAVSSRQRIVDAVLQRYTTPA
ncbi:MAG: HAD hydrolase family protein [Candidatus Eremiobacteraeota bacterium]|nr:HAD hydrolase family protein [Candidatus Eremiobacteraeota bacterium]